jgi:hypothetical protein
VSTGSTNEGQCLASIIDRRTSMASFTVRVVNDDQEGVSGVRVRLEFTSVLRGMSTEEHTDGDGYANFDGYDEGEIQVYLDGSSYGNYQYSDGEEITVTQ